MIEFCATEAKKFNPVSISGYRIREAGATAVKELAFTISFGITYVETCLSRGMAVDTFAPRLSFSLMFTMTFLKKSPSFRRRAGIWATLMRERFGAKTEASMKLRTHAQTAGVSLTAQQPVNNVARVTFRLGRSFGGHAVPPYELNG